MRKYSPDCNPSRKGWEKNWRHCKRGLESGLSVIGQQVHAIRKDPPALHGSGSVGSQATASSSSQTAPLASAQPAPVRPSPPPIVDLQQPPASSAPAAEIPIAAAELTDPRDFVKVIKHVDQPQGYKDEGKIYLQDSVLTLRDLNYAVSDGSKKPYPSYFIVADKGAPDGWLTVLYLYFRQFPTPQFGSDIPGIIDYINTGATPRLKQLWGFDLVQFRVFGDCHRELRQAHSPDKKASKKEEKDQIQKLANLLESKSRVDSPIFLAGQAEEPTADQQSNWMGRSWQKLVAASQSKPYAVIGLLIAVLVAGLFGVFQLISQESRLQAARSLLHFTHS